ncbi:energy transducer TonB [Campylobacter sp. RM12327]|uniref:energy transducer TonB n=1 Tax=Campylobacter sputorum TaxID=206 RepID=UPI000B77D7BC|nr:MULTISPECIES: energy transducer TonB [Campylobacter]ASM40849.1 energy transduction protein TonB [Campylobacter sputorum]MBE7358433.1 energy transducer TonB [Campylobacter sp. RM11302]MBF6669392.1 energy transducer TonB [Campylobacter sp. RM12327]MBF6674660.1 energy transducer TonB [Campylobacter sp. RM13538]MBF6675687.1 energy transducer TonB [Campylobacter sp. RM12321]
MNNNKKRLFVSIFISTCIYVSAFAAYHYGIQNEKTNISFSDNIETRSAFSVSFTQIASNDTNKDSSANSDIVSDEMSNIESIQDDVVEISDSQESSKIIESSKDIIKEPVIIKKEVTNKKMQKEIKKEIHKCKNGCKKSSINQKKTSLVKSSNNVNIAGGNTASGTKKDNDGTNIAGLIYKAILKYKTYPKKAEIMGIQGRVVVSFKLKDKDNFEILQVSSSSGANILDKHALAIIDKAKVDFPIEVIGTQINVPINFNSKELR